MSGHASASRAGESIKDNVVVSPGTPHRHHHASPHLVTPRQLPSALKWRHDPSFESPGSYGSSPGSYSAYNYRQHGRYENTGNHFRGREDMMVSRRDDEEHWYQRQPSQDDERQLELHTRDGSRSEREEFTEDTGVPHHRVAGVKQVAAPRRVGFYESRYNEYFRDGVQRPSRRTVLGSGPIHGSMPSKECTPSKRPFHPPFSQTREPHGAIHPAFIPPKRQKRSDKSETPPKTIVPRIFSQESNEEGRHEGYDRWYQRTHSFPLPSSDHYLYNSSRHLRQSLSFPTPWSAPNTDAVPRALNSSAVLQRSPVPMFAEEQAHLEREGGSRQQFVHTAGSSFDAQVPSRGFIQRSFSANMYSRTPPLEIGRKPFWMRGSGPLYASERMTPPRQALRLPTFRDSTTKQGEGGTFLKESESFEAAPRPQKMDHRYHIPSMMQTPDFGNMAPSHIVHQSQAPTSQSHDASPLLLLSQPEDRISLSDTLCTIRENIEVFRATTEDVKAPAPGRKHPVVVGQVGLRCIHCRHTKQSSERVKRAVCYPSSIKRIYRTVIDMKLDHFAHCTFVPQKLKTKLDELKAINTRSTGTTMQYFVKAAKGMGMEDGPSGVLLRDQSGQSMQVADKTQNVQNVLPAQKTPVVSPGKSHGGKVALSPRSSPDSHGTILQTKEHESKDDSAGPYFLGQKLLALPDDKTALSPLRCFLRENVCAFTATTEDIAVRTPTTFSVICGQVGIGCIHCLELPAKERSNRAVCFPFSIGRIYQSVADIQRFHLGECKKVPHAIREKFIKLQDASSKGSKGLATRQYWISAAKRIGLVDTDKGIRFIRNPSVQTSPAVSLSILAQVASDVNTVSKPLVLPEDKPHIAEFLYKVMEQLQPCRFTEADRNKRRLKNVGCIGVECKHCAGSVEGRKFFWSSVNAVESNFVSVHTHVMECKMIPPDLKKELGRLKELRKEQTGKLKTGSQKAFFARVWKRLHEEGKTIPTTDAKRMPRKGEEVGHHHHPLE